jgi:hypothetical protein
MAKLRLKGISTSIEELTYNNSGELYVKFYDTDEVYKYQNIEIDLFADIQRSYDMLNKRKLKGTLDETAKKRWSIGEYFNKNIRDKKEYKWKEVEEVQEGE